MWLLNVNTRAFWLQGISPHAALSVVVQTWDEVWPLVPALLLRLKEERRRDSNKDLLKCMETWRCFLLSCVAAQNPCVALQEEGHYDSEKVGCLYFLFFFVKTLQGKWKICRCSVSGTVTFSLLQNRFCFFVTLFTVLKKGTNINSKGKKRNNVN